MSQSHESTEVVQAPIAKSSKNPLERLTMAAGTAMIGIAGPAIEPPTFVQTGIMPSQDLSGMGFQILTTDQMQQRQNQQLEQVKVPEVVAEMINIVSSDAGTNTRLLVGSCPESGGKNVIITQRFNGETLVSET